jgi:hypothetical protein
MDRNYFAGKLHLSPTCPNVTSYFHCKVVEVETVPIRIYGEKDAWLLWYGFPVTFTELPVDKANPTANPLTNTNRMYHVKFIGEKHRPREIDIVLKDNTGWFDNHTLNQ